jgi:hypothetical protein
VASAGGAGAPPAGAETGFFFALFLEGFALISGLMGKNSVRCKHRASRVFPGGARFLSGTGSPLRRARVLDKPPDMGKMPMPPLNDRQSADARVSRDFAFESRD